MSTVYIGNAVCDEHGNARGGEPGNQSGKELRIQPWYKNKKGWLVFRPKSAEIAEKLAYCMKAACENMAIGYNQGRRNTLYNVAKPLGFDCAKVTTPCECDCSSLVRVCLAYAGIMVRDFNTSSEPSRLIATGEFDNLTDAKYTGSQNYLKAGDILVTAIKGHTCIVLNDGPDAERPEPEPIPDPEPKRYVEVIGKSVRVRASDSILGKTLFIAHKGNRYELAGIAPSGWYQILTAYPDSYITNKAKYTKLVEK